MARLTAGRVTGVRSDSVNRKLLSFAGKSSRRMRWRARWRAAHKRCHLLYSLSVGVQRRWSFYMSRNHPLNTERCFDRGMQCRLQRASSLSNGENVWRSAMEKTTNLPELSKIMEDFKRESETMGLQATNSALCRSFLHKVLIFCTSLLLVDPFFCGRRRQASQKTQWKERLRHIFL